PIFRGIFPVRRLMPARAAMEAAAVAVAILVLVVAPAILLTFQPGSSLKLLLTYPSVALAAASRSGASTPAIIQHKPSLDISAGVGRITTTLDCRVPGPQVALA